MVDQYLDSHATDLRAVLAGVQARAVFGKLGGANSPDIKTLTERRPKVFASLEDRLSKMEWLATDGISIADLQAYFELQAGTANMGVDLSSFPKLTAWMSKIGDMPDVKEVLKPFNVFSKCMKEKMANTKPRAKPKLVYFGI